MSDYHLSGLEHINLAMVGIFTAATTS